MNYSRGWRMVAIAQQKPKKSWGTYPSGQECHSKEALGSSSLGNFVNNSIDQPSEQYKYDSDHDLLKPIDETGGTYEEDPFAWKREALDEEGDNYESQMCKEVAKILSPKKRPRVEQNDVVVPCGVDKIAGSSDELNEFVNTSESLVPVSEKGNNRVDGRNELHLLYSDVTNILNNFSEGPEERIKDMQIDMQIDRNELSVSNGDDQCSESPRVLDDVQKLTGNGDDGRSSGRLEQDEDGTKKKGKRKRTRNRSVLERCQCEKKCYERIDDERRKHINEQYWKKSYERQGDWLIQTVKPVDIHRIRLDGEERQKERSCQFSYYLTKENGEVERVCQVFFLRTLGYSSNKTIVSRFKSINPCDISAPSDNRGKHSPANKTSEEAIRMIQNHIESCNPSISHYRRKHAPLRRYLPSELNTHVLFQYFSERYPELNVKYKTYWQQVRELNISFAKLGLEECETCLVYEAHREIGIKSKYKNDGVDFVLAKVVNEVECICNNCEVCSDFKKHIKRAKLSREEYKKDVKEESPSEFVKVATDMQKVIMLPRIPGVKTVVFTRRLTMYHMTFAPLGGISQGLGKPVGIIWHEAIMGRADEDVTSSFIKFIRYMRDAKKFLFWVDNCSAQNKNWTLYTTLCFVVNSSSFKCETITLKYFEAGHTFMAADAFHKEIEDEMKNQKNLYDFEDFVKVVNARGIAVEMGVTDFQQFESKLSKAKGTCYPKLDAVLEVEFRKGSKKMFWKEDKMATEFKEGEFLQKKFIKIMGTKDAFPTTKTSQGLPTEKKVEIIKKLCPFMEEDRKIFWRSIPTNNVTTRLVKNCNSKRTNKHQ